jgi:hypothetical protein
MSRGSLECRRNAPIIPKKDYEPKFPLVQTHHWCGQFEQESWALPQGWRIVPTCISDKMIEARILEWERWSYGFNPELKEPYLVCRKAKIEIDLNDARENMPYHISYPTVQLARENLIFLREQHSYNAMLDVASKLKNAPRLED